MKRKTKTKGNISLTLVLIFTAVLISIGINLILTSIDLSFNSKAFISAATNRSIARSCIEDAASKIKMNNTYTGVFTITMSNGSCTATIANSATSGVKIISVSSVYDSYNYSEIKKLDTNTSPFTISN